MEEEEGEGERGVLVSGELRRGRVGKKSGRMRGKGLTVGFYSWALSGFLWGSAQMGENGLGGPIWFRNWVWVLQL